MPVSALSGQLDPHGEAALLLVESLLHEMMESTILTGEQALAAVQTAVDTEAEIAFDRQGAPASRPEAGALLGAIRHSLHTK